MTSSIQFDWKAAFWSGIIAGITFLVLEMVLIPVFGGESHWGLSKMVAAIVLGKGVLTSPATLDMGIMLVAMVSHFVMSIGFAVAFALAVSRLKLESALALGEIGGLVLYWVNSYGFTGLFPWPTMAINWISIFGYLVFGIVAAGTYVGIRNHHLREELRRRISLRLREV